MAKIPKPIFACFGINEICQFWVFPRLPNSATHFVMDSGSFYTLMFAIFGKNVHYVIYFYISAYIMVLVFSLRLPNLAKFTTQFCWFWHNPATHTGINSGSVYKLMFAIFDKNVHYFYISIYQLT